MHKSASRCLFARHREATSKRTLRTQPRSLFSHRATWSIAAGCTFHLPQCHSTWWLGHSLVLLHSRWKAVEWGQTGIHWLAESSALGLSSSLPWAWADTPGYWEGARRRPIAETLSVFATGDLGHSDKAIWKIYIPLPGIKSTFSGAKPYRAVQAIITI